MRQEHLLLSDALPCLIIWNLKKSANSSRRLHLWSDTLITKTNIDGELMKQKVINSSFLSESHPLFRSSHSWFKQGWMCLVACHVYAELLQTHWCWIMTTIWGEEGQTHSKASVTNLTSSHQSWMRRGDDKMTKGKLWRKNFESNFCFLLHPSLAPSRLVSAVQKVKAPLLSRRMSAVSVSTPQTWNANRM